MALLTQNITSGRGEKRGDRGKKRKEKEMGGREGMAKKTDDRRMRRREGVRRGKRGKETEKKKKISDHLFSQKLLW